MQVAGQSPGSGLWVGHVLCAHAAGGCRLPPPCSLQGPGAGSQVQGPSETDMCAPECVTEVLPGFLSVFSRVVSLNLLVLCVELEAFISGRRVHWC